MCERKKNEKKRDGRLRSYVQYYACLINTMVTYDICVCRVGTSTNEQKHTKHKPHSPLTHTQKTNTHNHYKF